MKRSDLLRQYNDHLILRNYRPKTIISYLRSIKNFFDYSATTSNIEWDKSEYVKAFLLDRFKKGCSWSSVNIDYSAIRILFIEVLKQDWDHEFVRRPRGQLSMPAILSGRQVESMINHLTNIKHKTIVTLLYTTGIRLSELINLDVSHLLLDRKQLRIVNGKGGKDRVISIPTTALIIINCYLESYKPNQILIEGNPKGSRYSCSSVRKIVKRTANKVGIQTRISPHSLRHAYATHHIENGTNLVSLQQQLGHKDISTTIKYVHLCKISQRHINHPILKLNIDLPNRTI